MNYMKCGLYAAAMAVLAAALGNARTIYVTPWGTNDAAGFYSNWAGASTSIQAAVTAASDGDTIYVTNATYVLASQIDVSGKAINLLSWKSGVLDRTGTIINANGSSRCLYVAKSALPAPLIAGFTFTNGNAGASGGGGAAIYGGAGYVGVLSNCIVTGCKANQSGGGIYIQGSNVMVANCDVFNNVCTNTAVTGGYGGGICMDQGTVRNCTVYGNTLWPAGVNTSDGGGIGIVSYSVNNTIIGCVISNNSAAYFGGGAGGMLFGGNITFVSNIVCYNVSGDGGGLLIWGMATNSLIAHCTFYGNRTTNAAGNGGGAMMFYQTYAGLVSNCVFYANSSASAGGAIRAYQAGNLGSFLVTHCKIYGNTASSGGGAHVDASSFALQNSIISNNVANSYAGGVLLTRSFVTNAMRNCLIVNNAATNTGIANGGGVLVQGNVPVENCTIVNNSVPSGQLGGGVYLNGSGVLRSSIVYNNTPANWFRSAGGDAYYSCTTPTNGLTGANNIPGDPLFVNTNAINYRLLQGSPCINSGSNDNWMSTAVDLDGHPRLDRFSGNVDMGAYEFISKGTLIRLH